MTVVTGNIAPMEASKVLLGGTSEPTQPPALTRAGTFMPGAVANAVLEVMSKVRNVEKNGTNTFFNYKFARVEDLMVQVQPAMVEAGLLIIQSEVDREVNSDLALLTITYGFSLVHRSGEGWTESAYHTGMASIKNHKGTVDDKAGNKCHTAARKYFLLGLLQVPVGDLPDADEDDDRAPGRNAAPPPPKGNPDAVEAMISAINRCLDSRDFQNWVVDFKAAAEALNDNDYHAVMGAFKAAQAKIKSQSKERN